jgi:hypothetical protein
MSEMVREVTHIKTPAARVLDSHVELYERLRNPTQGLIQYIETYAEDTQSKNREPELMFYPFYRKPGDPDREPDWERNFLRHLSATLGNARTYQVTGEMVDVLRGVYQKTAARMGHLEEAELPCDAGFVWLDEPFTSRDTHGKMTSSRAISWALTAVKVRDAAYKELDIPSSVRVIPGVRLTFWSLWGDFNDYELEQQWDEKTIDGLTHSLGALSMGHTMVLPFGQRFGSWSREESENGEDMGHLVHALWMLLESELPSVTQASIDRPSRRRALRSIKQNEVSVVTLRRSKESEKDDDYDPRHIDWTCRWLVQGHWRTLHSGKCVWIRPHVKGPENRPLRATRKLYRLSR